MALSACVSSLWEFMVWEAWFEFMPLTKTWCANQLCFLLMCTKITKLPVIMISGKSRKLYVGYANYVCKIEAEPFCRESIHRRLKPFTTVFQEKGLMNTELTQHIFGLYHPHHEGDVHNQMKILWQNWAKEAPAFPSSLVVNVK